MKTITKFVSFIYIPHLYLIYIFILYTEKYSLEIIFYKINQVKNELPSKLKSKSVMTFLILIS